MFKNDERYWDINLLNKWFAISSIIFLVVTVWVFVDDNDDEFKVYQKEFRKLEIEIAQKKLDAQAAEIEKDKSIYEDALADAQKEFNRRESKLNDPIFITLLLNDVSARILPKSYPTPSKKILS